MNLDNLDYVTLSTELDFSTPKAFFSFYFNQK